MKQELTFELSIEEFNKLLDIVHELNKVSDIHKIKWDGEDVLFSSVLSETGTTKVNAIKIYSLKTNSLFSGMPSDFEGTFVILNGKEFLKQFKILGEDVDKITMTLNYKDDEKIIYYIQASTDILEINVTSGDLKIAKDIPKQWIKNNMNPDFSLWSFNVTEDFFKKVKKLSKLNDSDFLSIRVDDDQISFKDVTWNLKADHKSNIEHTICKFKKTHLDRVTLSEEIQICIFEASILIKEKESFLLFTLDLF